MDELALLTPGPTLHIGRTKTLHKPRVLIEDSRVVVRTRCGLDPVTQGFTETFGIATCSACIDQEADRG